MAVNDMEPEKVQLLVYILSVLIRPTVSDIKQKCKRKKKDQEFFKRFIFLLSVGECVWARGEWTTNPGTVTVDCGGAVGVPVPSVTLRVGCITNRFDFFLTQSLKKKKKSTLWVPKCLSTHSRCDCESLDAGLLTAWLYWCFSFLFALQTWSSETVGAGELSERYGVIEKVHSASWWSWSSFELHSHALQAFCGAMELRLGSFQLQFSHSEQISQDRREEKTAYKCH